MVMKVSVNSKQFWAAVKAARNAAALTSSLIPLTCVKIEGDEKRQVVAVSGTNLALHTKVELDADVQAGGATALSANMFTAVVRQLASAGEKIRIETDDSGHCAVTCGTAEFNFNLECEVGDFPEFPDVKGEDDVLQIQSADLRCAIEGTLFSTSDDTSRLILTGALFTCKAGSNQVTVMTTDGYRVSRRSIPTTVPLDRDVHFVLSAEALKEFSVNSKALGGKETSIHVGSEHVLFDNGSVKVLGRRISGEYPDLSAYLERPQAIEAKVSRDELYAAVSSCVLVDAAPRCLVLMTLSTDSVKVEVQSCAGRAQAMCSSTCQYKHAPDSNGVLLQIGMNSAYLLEALKHSTSPSIVIGATEPISPLFLTPDDVDDGTGSCTEDFLYMMLPINTKGRRGSAQT